MGKEYFEDTWNALGSSDDEKPKTEGNILKDAVEINTRSQLFHDMESGDSGQDDHITIMTSHLSLGTNAPKEHDSCVKVRVPSPIPVQFSHHDPEDISRLKEFYEDTFGPKSQTKPPSPTNPDSISNLVDTYDKAVIA